MKVLVTGATGFIGKHVVQTLIDRKHEVVVLSRNTESAQKKLPSSCNFFEWNPKEPAPKDAFSGVGGVIHLAGKPILGKWTEKYKKDIFESRVYGTKNLITALEQLKEKPNVYISASALGFYGDRANKLLSEDSSVGRGFLANTCYWWEKNTFEASAFGIRAAAIRIGIVLGNEGGMLPQILPIFKSGLGGRIGNGKQWMSWIHIRDLANLFVYILENERLEGVFNGSSPNPVINQDFTKTLGKVLFRPAWLPVPAFILKIIYGELASLFLMSAKLSHEKVRSTGFEFDFPNLKSALENLLEK